MKILKSENLPLPEFNATVVTMGNFDGVHAGHQELIRNALSDAHENGLKCVLVTFHPHPAVYFNPDHAITPPICSVKYKEKLIRRLGVDALLTLSFDTGLANMEPGEFVEDILIDKLHARIIWIGYDFTFGINRSGNVRSLIELGENHAFRTNVLNPQRIVDLVVSSTKIRELILQGQVDTAARLLRRLHIIRGMVVRGDAIGRTIGFPTINLEVKEGLIPRPGIYSGMAYVQDREYAAAIYIGTCPTFQDRSFRVEAHLLDYSSDLYQSETSLAFLKFLREDIKFSDPGDLKNQIRLDCQQSQRDVEEYRIKSKEIPIIW